MLIARLIFFLSVAGVLEFQIARTLRWDNTKSEKSFQKDHRTSVIDFQHEHCPTETQVDDKVERFHEVGPYFERHNHELNLLVKLRGEQDGYIYLTPDTSLQGFLYWIILGTYDNQFSEIRRSKDRENIKISISTPEIMSPFQWRGFHIKYKQNTGELSVYLEGSGFPLMELKDEHPLQVDYFSFGTCKEETIQIAFNCHAKDRFSTISKVSSMEINVTDANSSTTTSAVQENTTSLEILDEVMYVPGNFSTLSPSLQIRPQLTMVIIVASVILIKFLCL